MYWHQNKAFTENSPKSLMLWLCVNNFKEKCWQLFTWSTASASAGPYNHQCSKLLLGSSSIRSAQCESWVSPEWHRCAGCAERRVGSQPLMNWLCVLVIRQHSKIHLGDCSHHSSMHLECTWKKKQQSLLKRENANDAWHSSSAMAVSCSHSKALNDWWNDETIC